MAEKHADHPVTLMDVSVPNANPKLGPKFQEIVKKTDLSVSDILEKANKLPTGKPLSIFYEEGGSKKELRIIGSKKDIAEFVGAEIGLSGEKYQKITKNNSEFRIEDEHLKLLVKDIDYRAAFSRNKGNESLYLSRQFELQFAGKDKQGNQLVTLKIDAGKGKDKVNYSEQVALPAGIELKTANIPSHVSEDGDKLPDHTVLVLTSTDKKVFSGNIFGLVQSASSNLYIDVRLEKDFSSFRYSIIDEKNVISGGASSLNELIQGIKK